jgi:hypothetical protein
MAESYMRFPPVHGLSASGQQTVRHGSCFSAGRSEYVCKGLIQQNQFLQRHVFERITYRSP